MTDISPEAVEPFKTWPEEPRFCVSQGKFGSYFHDRQHEKDLSLEEVEAYLNNSVALSTRVEELERESEILNRVIADIDERLCCDGTDCGCRGSTKAEQARHYIIQEALKAEGV